MKIQTAGIISVLILIPIASHAFCFEEAGVVHGINPDLLMGIAKIESGLNPNAVNINSNGSKDIGLMQINSSWIPGIGLDRARLMSDPCYNVMTGAKILRMCIDRHGYEWKAVGCYNAVNRSKRIEYSWKVYNLLKKTEAGKINNEKDGHKLRVTSNKSEPSAFSLQPSDQDPAISARNSSLSFSVRDTAAVE